MFYWTLIFLKRKSIYYATTKTFIYENQPTLKRPLARITRIYFGILSFLILFSCDRPPSDKPNSEKFTLIGKSQYLHQIDAGEEGHSHGDIRIFEGSLMDKISKNIVGQYTATRIDEFLYEFKLEIFP